MKAQIAALIALMVLSSNGAAMARDVGRSTDSQEYLKNTALLPVKALAVGTAFTVGVPIAIARTVANRSGEYVEAVGSELDRNDFITPEMALSVPGQGVRTIGAGFEGLAAGTLNATRGWDRPFSARSFSMESLRLFD